MAAEAGARPEVLNIDEAAALLRVTPEVVREMAEAQRMPARRIGDAWRFSRVALLDWLSDGQAALTPRAALLSPLPGIPDSTRLPAGDLYALSARGAAPPTATRLAQATPAAKPQAASTPPPTVGERPETPNAEEIALRDQRVLLKRGAATVDFGFSYTHSEQTVPSILRQEQSAFGASAALRYGLFEDLQITARLPGIWRRTTTYTGGAPGETTRENYVGDASLSLLGMALREAVGRPNIIWSIDSMVPTGPGDRGLGGGLVFSKSYDPAVLFAGLNYLHGFSVDPTSARRTLAQHNFGLTMGYTYALNDALALSTAFVGTYRNTRRPDANSLPPPHERYQLQLGMTWRLARGVFVEPSVAMRLGGASPDAIFSLNVPYSF
jgi:excisionase family DNA binding protein